MNVRYLALPRGGHRRIRDIRGARKGEIERRQSVIFIHSRIINKLELESSN